MRKVFLAGVVALAAGATAGAATAQEAMSFFVTSANPGNGGDLGGLAGADAWCTELAEKAGAGGKTWHAYLSTSTENARDRIGAGPWLNAKGEVIAENIGGLHSADNRISKDTALTETGQKVNGRGDDPNTHDMLTGSNPDGTWADGKSCNDWTSQADDAVGMVGHHDRMGLDDSPPARSWNSSHATRGGCGMGALKSTGGAGLFYCFAVE